MQWGPRVAAAGTAHRWRAAGAALCSCSWRAHQGREGAEPAALRWAVPPAARGTLVRGTTVATSSSTRLSRFARWAGARSGLQLVGAQLWGSAGSPVERSSLRRTPGPWPLGLPQAWGVSPDAFRFRLLFAAEARAGGVPAGPGAVGRQRAVALRLPRQLPGARGKRNSTLVGGIWNEIREPK